VLDDVWRPITGQISLEGAADAPTDEFADVSSCAMFKGNNIRFNGLATGEAEVGNEVSHLEEEAVVGDVCVRMPAAATDNATLSGASGTFDFTTITGFRGRLGTRSLPPVAVCWHSRWLRRFAICDRRNVCKNRGSFAACRRSFVSVFAAGSVTTSIIVVSVNTSTLPVSMLAAPVLPSVLSSTCCNIVAAVLAATASFPVGSVLPSMTWGTPICFGGNTMLLTPSSNSQTIVDLLL
jgi:hypothetical protein